MYIHVHVNAIGHTITGQKHIHTLYIHVHNYQMHSPSTPRTCTLGMWTPDSQLKMAGPDRHHVMYMYVIYMYIYVALTLVSDTLQAYTHMYIHVYTCMHYMYTRGPAY